MTRVLAYVDGYNLYYGLRRQRWLEFLWLDIPKLIGHFVLPGETLLQTRYFTSKVKDDSAKMQRQQTYLDALTTLAALDIRRGNFARRRRHCRTCGSKWQTYIEKMTDTGMAAEIVADAALNSFDTAVLLCGDSDMIPVVKMVKSLAPDKKVRVVIPPATKCLGLTKICDSNHKVRKKHLVASQLPATVYLPNGSKIECPEMWKQPQYPVRKAHPIPKFLRRPMV